MIQFLDTATGRPLPTCAECGSITVRDGARHRCINCGGADLFESVAAGEFSALDAARISIEREHRSRPWWARCLAAAFDTAFT